MAEKIQTVKGRYVEKVSKNTGNRYNCLILEIAPGVEKMVMLDKAEIALLKMLGVEFVQE